LAVGILNKFFRFGLPAQLFPPHVFNEIVKNGVNEEKKEDE
jgi:hypothetical protein